MTESTSSRCYDWICVKEHHYARDKECFSYYREVEGECMGDKVIGVGTVELELKESPNSLNTNKIVLYNVLHIPSAVCNGFWHYDPALHLKFHLQKDVTQFWLEKGKQNDKPVGYAIGFRGFLKLVLAGHSEGMTYMAEGKHYLLDVFVARYEAKKIGLSRGMAS